MQQSSCPLCSSTNATDKYTVQGYEYGQCDTCQLIYRVSLPDVAVHTSRLEVDSAHRFAEVQTHTYLTNGHLLDIGAGQGEFVSYVEQAGWQAWGLEPSEDAAKIAQQNSLNVIHGPYTEEVFNPASFDVITIWGALPPEPIPLLDHLQNLLKDEGWVVLHMPNVGSWKARLAGRRWRWLSEGHPAYFDKKTLTSLLNKSGMEIKTLTTEQGDLMTAYAQKADSTHEG